MIESGMNVRGESKLFYSTQLSAAQSSNDRGGHHQIVCLEFVSKIFYVFLVCLNSTLIIFLIEILYIKIW